MSEHFKGDYMGFTYNGKHSSAFGIVRTSDGSRFNENLLPSLQDKTVQVPGGDGVYYFGSYYTQRQFNIPFAFDSMTEEQYRDLKAWFSGKTIADLIFDEAPYKVYKAKVTGNATIKHIPFGKQGERIYKGEGNVQFTCYQPFARCRFTGTETIEELRETYPNIDEWWDAARIAPDKNFGDISASFQVELSGKGSLTIGAETLTWDLAEGKTAILDTKTGIAIDNEDEICNQYIEGNVCMKIPPETKVPTATETYKNFKFSCYYL